MRAFAIVAMLAACGPPGSELVEKPPKVVASEVNCTDPFAGEGKLRFDPEGWKTNFCRKSVPLRELRGGGPPRDGIPPIDAPKFVPVESADAWIGDREPVIAVRSKSGNKSGNKSDNKSDNKDIARAYPLQILTWHEIVNDTIAGKPIAVTFCPLCYAAIVFVRPEHDGVVLTFGTSGNLRRSDLVMWDRQTESWWQQFSGEAIVGALTGSVLEQLPAAIISWADFKKSYPAGEVLGRDTGFARDYGRNPYAGYDDIAKKPFLYEGDIDGAHPPMEHVVGVIRGKAKEAFALSRLRREPAINAAVGDTPLVVLWRAGGASALAEARIADAVDIGVTGVFDRRIHGRTLTFEHVADGRFRDRETLSTWNILGAATSGPLAGKRLKPLPHHNVFWFVWSAFALR